MGKEKAHINIAVVGHVDSDEKSTEQANKPVAQAPEMSSCPM